MVYNNVICGGTTNFDGVDTSCTLVVGAGIFHADNKLIAAVIKHYGVAGVKLTLQVYYSVIYISFVSASQV